MFLRQIERRVRTARRTSIGASSRTSVSTAAGWCRGTFCIWARSIRRRRRCGARRSRCSTRTRAALGRWPLFGGLDPQVAVDDTPRWCGCGFRKCACIDRDSRRLLVGGPVVASCNSTSSGPSACRRAGSERAGTVLRVLVAYRLIEPGSEWRLHREWFGKSAMADLLGSVRPHGRGAQALCLPRVARPQGRALFSHLTERWRDPVQRQFRRVAVRSDPAHLLRGQRLRFARGRQAPPRPTAATSGRTAPQLVIALVVTPEGLPLAYEVLPGNTADSKRRCGRF